MTPNGSRRHSAYMGSPRSQHSSTMETGYNPYEAVQKKQELYQNNNGNSPTVIIEEDPYIPNYKELSLANKKTNYNMKIVVVGDGGCGKTCLLLAYTQNKFPSIYVPTVFENYVTAVQSPNGKTVELALWDTAGQEEYDRLRPLSYPDVDILLVCFAVDNEVSLENVKDMWFPEVNHYCPGIPIILVGTKSDLLSDMNQDASIRVAKEIGAIGLIFTSAKTMFNVRTVFNFALNHFQRNMELQEQYEKTLGSRKRISRVLGGSNGGSGNHSRHHSRNYSNVSNNRRGHLKNTSYDSTALLDQPLTEDTYVKNPYGNFGYKANVESPYNQDEFAFTRERKKKKKCVIL